MFSAPISFDSQDEGHTAHGPLSWKVIQNHYSEIGQYPYKKSLCQHFHPMNKSHLVDSYRFFRSVG
jgi:hypothetical protein